MLYHGLPWPDCEFRHEERGDEILKLWGKNQSVEAPSGSEHLEYTIRYNQYIHVYIYCIVRMLEILRVSEDIYTIYINLHQSTLIYINLLL